MKRKDESILIKTDKAFKGKVQIVSASVDMTISQFTREALREKMARTVRSQKAESPLFEKL